MILAAMLNSIATTGALNGTVKTTRFIDGLWNQTSSWVGLIRSTAMVVDVDGVRNNLTHLGADFIS